MKTIKITLTMILIVMIGPFLFSQSINQYDILKIGTIAAGKTKEKIGYDETALFLCAIPGPDNFEISKNNQLYIPDIVNRKINVYDLNLAYLKTIIENKETTVHAAFKILVDDNENLIALTAPKNLVKIDNKGNTLLKIKAKNLPHQIKGWENFFSINSRILFYDDEKNIRIINETEIEADQNKIEMILTQLDQEEEWSEMNLLSPHFKDPKLKLTENQLEKFRQLKKNGKKIIIGDQFYSTKINDHKQYYRQIKEIVPGQIRKEFMRQMKQKITKNSMSKNDLFKYENVKLDDFKEIDFIDNDQDHNSYWKAQIHTKIDETNHIIIIISKFGDIIDIFQYGQRRKGKNNTQLYATSGAITAVAPNGDIYFMKRSPSAYTFYKVTRQW